VDSRSLALLGRLVAKRAISAARLVSWMMLYSAGVVHRPRLKDVGRSSSALVALLLRSTWVGIAGLKGLVGTDRWLSQLAAITIFQIASWAVRKAVAARPGLVLARRGGLLPLLSAVGMPLLPGWADDAERVADLTVALERCRTYAEHRRVAVALDRATGMQAWRERDDALPLGLLNVSDLKDRITRYKRLERDGDAHGLMWSLRADLHRRPAGSGSPQLYGMALSGTKLVVEEHSKVTASALDFLCDECEPESVPARLSFFQEARHAFGRSALLLSGGATNGIYHLGVIRALRDVHLLPPIVSGASAGSIVAALLGCKVSSPRGLPAAPPSETVARLRHGPRHPPFLLLPRPAATTSPPPPPADGRGAGPHPAGRRVRHPVLPGHGPSPARRGPGRRRGAGCGRGRRRGVVDPLCPRVALQRREHVQRDPRGVRRQLPGQHAAAGAGGPDLRRSVPPHRPRDQHPRRPSA